LAADADRPGDGGPGAFVNYPGAAIALRTLIFAGLFIKNRKHDGEE
jgi:hypothetical protein